MLNPLKFVAEATREYTRTALRNRRLISILGALDALVRRTKTARWRSGFLYRTKSVTPERAEAIVDAVFYDKRARKEVKRAIDRLGGVGGSLFWDVYLRRTWNSIMPFTDGYQSLMQLANTSLPVDGTIADWTAGSGLLLAALSVAGPERKPVALDANPRGIISTKRLFKNLFPPGGPLVAKTLDPFDADASLPSADGAIVHNLLMLLDADESKVALLARFGQSLKTGGQLLLIEPKPSLQKQSLLRLWTMRVAKSAAFNRSAANEHDLALFVEVNRRFFAETETQFSPTTELVAIARAAGFETSLVRDVLYGHFTALLLTKLPPKPKREPVIRYHDDPEN